MLKFEESFLFKVFYVKSLMEIGLKNETSLAQRF